MYAEDQIGQTLSDQFSDLPIVSTGRKFPLSWFHYFKLMRIDNTDQHHFCEIEAVQNHWGLKELQGQFDSALYERLALSWDKDAPKHNDPFDRILLSQAKTENMNFVTHDTMFLGYGESCIVLV